MGARIWSAVGPLGGGLLRWLILLTLAASTSESVSSEMAFVAMLAAALWAPRILLSRTAIVSKVREAIPLRVLCLAPFLGLAVFLATGETYLWGCLVIVLIGVSEAFIGATQSLPSMAATGLIAILVYKLGGLTAGLATSFAWMVAHFVVAPPKAPRIEGPDARTGVMAALGETLGAIFVVNVVVGSKYGIPSYPVGVLETASILCLGALLGSLTSGFRALLHLTDSGIRRASFALVSMVLLAHTGLRPAVAVLLILANTALFSAWIHDLRRGHDHTQPAGKFERVAAFLPLLGTLVYSVLGLSGGMRPGEGYVWIGLGALALSSHPLAGGKDAACATASSPLAQILMLFVGTRLALGAMGVAAHALLGGRHGSFPFTGMAWLDLWGQWDSAWYLSIANDGYSSDQSGPYANYGFFPLYPILIRVVGWVVGDPFVSALLISNASLLAACWLLYKLALIDSDEADSGRAIRYLFLLPVAFVLSSALTESLYLALVLGAMYCARKESWLLAGSLGFFAALTRYIGVALFIPLVYEYLKARGFRPSQIRPNILWLLLVPFGLILFMAMCFQVTGDWFAYFRIKFAGWSHRVSEPGMLITTAINGGTEAQVQAWIAVSSLALLFGWGHRLRFSYWIFGFYSLAIPLLGGLIYGIPRHAAVTFPLFLILARIGSRPAVDLPLSITLAILQGALMVMWGLGLGVVV
ncbi:MAG TPA: mannosyltransferase family protein [Planctomycetota bacterium]|nr:mannosyltransferase family protein [Planctomycetota bacterium]